jgi:endothelin-converting enzyme/putative endopeptidase
MPPSEVNAYYSPENNQMVFPAGILQAPFYSDKAPVAVNYGAGGMVMGHELTHGFDDEGRRFDASGNLRDWWTPAVAAEFDKRSACLVHQYDQYVAVDTLHVNGRLTLGENIADQGGIKLAYGAWARTSGGQGPAVAGFDAKQQFFLGFAQSWCSKLRPEFQRLRVTTDPHAPERFRVNGPLANFAEFGAAFGCKAGAPMAPVQRCQIW